jgi:hypothetical protein
MITTENNLKTYEPEISLSAQEIGYLSGLVYHPGFAFFQKIGKSTVDRFILAWLNQKTDADIIEAHRSAKVAAQLYTMLINRINQEVTDYRDTVKENSKPVDSGESLDMGEIAAEDVGEAFI